MHKLIPTLSLFLLTAFSACKMDSPANDRPDFWDGSVTDGFAMLDSNTVRLIKPDIITQDIKANKREGDYEKNRVTTYYFRINRDSSVTIVHGAMDEVGDPIIWRNMEKSVQEDFGRAKKFAEAQGPKY